jgi:hypothetical protein
MKIIADFRHFLLPLAADYATTLLRRGDWPSRTEGYAQMTIFEAQWILIADDFRDVSRFKVRQALHVAKAHEWIGVTYQSQLAAQLWLDAVCGMRV